MSLAVYFERFLLRCAASKIIFQSRTRTSAISLMGSMQMVCSMDSTSGDSLRASKQDYCRFALGSSGSIRTVDANLW